MKGKAEWLFRHHKAFCLKKYVLSVRLKQLTTAGGQAQVKNEWIESEAFRSSFMNEYVKNQHFYSPTEAIALHSEDAVRQELINERYLENKTLDAMIACQPEGMNIYSRQTMAKYCKHVLDHIEKLLVIIQLPKELYDDSSV